ncbi:SIS domain-containing protein, partial [Mesorhizobium sp.]|uniref:SIS domain-containing protein n=1 Tax=Mesorhizobium sp. TaxID=1871066 RepID=UPI0034509693
MNIARGLAHGLDASAYAIGISYERYEREAVAFLRTGRDRGAHTLAITTRDKSPVSGVAHEVLLLSSGADRAPWRGVGNGIGRRALR